jgi:hypothetical protein
VAVAISAQHSTQLAGLEMPGGTSTEVCEWCCSCSCGGQTLSQGSRKTREEEKRWNPRFRHRGPNRWSIDWRSTLIIQKVNIWN